MADAPDDAPPPLSAAETAARCRALGPGAHRSVRLQLLPLTVLSARSATPRLAFLEASAELQLIAKERDGWLAAVDISALVAAAESGLELREVSGFPELDDGRAFLHVACARFGDVLLPRNPPQPQPVALAAESAASVSVRPRNSGSWGKGNSKMSEKVFVDWLFSTFGAWLQQLQQASSSEKRLVLDVAGGSGKVAFSISCRRRVRCAIVDPRPAKVTAKQRAYFARAASDAEQKVGALFRGEAAAVDELVLAAAPEAAAFALEADLAGLPRAAMPLPLQLQGLFGVGFPAAQPALWGAAALCIGLHPDQATEPIVSLCLKHERPFAVVPCCVFPESNPQRRTAEGEAVREHEQFCEFLQGLDARMRRAELPLPGRNVVLFMLEEDFS